MQFYGRVLHALLDEGIIRRSDSLLVVCGGRTDADFLLEAGFSVANISNLDTACAQDYSPYQWSHQDAEMLSFPDANFDWAVVHGGLHHCASPHRALLEMCRVARKGVVVIEARDSALMRLAVRLGFTPEYELEAVVLHGFSSGGVRNSAVPNYIYRWTEREVKKTIESAYPDRQNEFRWFYGLELPRQRLTMARLPLRLAAYFLGFGAKVCQWSLPRQGNRFAFAILHNGDKPWIERSDDGVRLRPDFPLKFDPSKYAGVNSRRKDV